MARRSHVAVLLRRVACGMQGHDLVGVELPQGWSQQRCRTCGELVDAFRRPSEPIRAVKIAAFIPVSREPLNPSAVDPADVARWTTEREARESREDARQAALLTAGGVVAAIATLHSPDKNRDCQGCDGSDYGPSPWPCSTWDVLDEQAPE